MNSKTLLIFIIVKLLLIIFFTHRIIGHNSRLLKNSIALSYPQINSRDIADWEKVSLLRQWVSENIPWGSESVQLGDFIWEKDAPEAFKIFSQQTTGGVDCFGYAYLLMKLYKLYGYEAYSYHYGSLNDWNHVITLVKINSQNKKILAIQDATYDATCVNKKGAPFDFYDFLLTLKQNKPNEIKILQGQAKPHYSFCSANDNCQSLDNIKILKVLPNGTTVYKNKFKINDLENNMSSFLYARASKQV